MNNIDDAVRAPSVLDVAQKNIIEGRNLKFVLEFGNIFACLVSSLRMVTILASLIYTGRINRYIPHVLSMRIWSILTKESPTRVLR